MKKPVDKPPEPTPTHGGVYELKDGVLVPIAGGAPAQQTPAAAPQDKKEGES